MGVQPETPLQQRIKTLIRRRGGYCQKNHGDMTSEPGIPDIFACYKGVFLAIEAKCEGNKPSRQQGIHCRNIMNAGGITLVAWNTTDVEQVLNHIDYCYVQRYSSKDFLQEMEAFFEEYNIDNGSRW